MFFRFPVLFLRLIKFVCNAHNIHRQAKCHYQTESEARSFVLEENVAEIIRKHFHSAVVDHSDLFGS